ncbi:amidase [Pseudonocardia hydrocarbonoxydans]|uniref:Amidase n=1 Tax=Pseudonocardia hydrocarbonoxydans TaxID=76726 RepID=A0A4Y3WSZ9_9PSEU|nr:amidase [Pseudonocardia hydrocarbonoxydans]GEC22007.1 amidase [Pseudonocardia hydrocarbonoxydans]
MTSADLSAVELLAAYRTGELSPVEATHDALARIETYDPVVNAFCLVQADEAQAAAKESEARWHRGEPRGSLDGVPTSIKDLLLTAGRPTLRGSRTIDPAGPWEVDAPAVARLREHNAVIIGRTTTPELGWKGVTDSPLTGVTRNPWDPSTTAGGSSGGSAAAVALGMGALSLGTDGGGSVRIPAAFTGTSTIKPTYGRVPNWPASPYGTLAHVGPMTRSAADTALLLDAISGFDPRDPWALAPAAPTNGRLGETAMAGMRIAVSPTLGYVRLDPEVAAAFESAVDVFASLGALLTEADPGFTDPVEAFHTLWFSGAAKSIEHLGPEQRALMDPALVAVAEEGARASALDYLTAMAVRNDLGRTMGEFHTRHALLLTPTMPIPAFEAGVESPAGWGERWTSWTPFTYPFNMTQQPAASVPCGFTRGGLPIGLQIVGPRHADRAVLSAAHAFQAVTDWHLQRPRPATG